MRMTLEMALVATFLGLFILIVGFSNRDNESGLLMMYAGVVSLLSIVAYHIHIMVEGGY